MKNFPINLTINNKQIDLINIIKFLILNKWSYLSGVRKQFMLIFPYIFCTNHFHALTFYPKTNKLSVRDIWPDDYDCIILSNDISLTPEQFKAFKDSYAKYLLREGIAILKDDQFPKVGYGGNKLLH